MTTLAPECPLDAETLRKIQQGFLKIKGRIEGHAHKRFRHLHGVEREDAVAETLAIAWAAYRQLYLDGRNPDDLVGGIATFSVKRVIRGDKLTGREPVRDVMSANGRRRRAVLTLPRSNADSANPDIRHLASKGVSPADMAAFNVDLQEWFNGLDERQREVGAELAAGYTNGEVGAKRGRSRGWTNMVRRELRESWDEFEGGKQGR